MNTARLSQVVFNYPAIDNHAHPLLKASHKDSDNFPFEGLVSEAQGPSLLRDAPTTLACFRATIQLSKLYNLNLAQPSWEDIRQARKSIDYGDLCKMCLEPTNIQCILIDDGLGGVKEFAEDYKWHDKYTHSLTKRIVRVEIVAEVSSFAMMVDKSGHLT